MSTTTQTATEQAAIRRTLEHYVEGLRESSVDALRMAFHPDAIMTGYLGDKMMIMPIDGLYDLVSQTPAPSETTPDFSAQIGEIEVVGNTATGEVTEQNYIGHDFHDRMQLLKVDGEWKIIAKLFATT